MCSEEQYSLRKGYNFLVFLSQSLFSPMLIIEESVSMKLDIQELLMFQDTTTFQCCQIPESSILVSIFC